MRHSPSRSFTRIFSSFDCFGGGELTSTSTLGCRFWPANSSTVFDPTVRAGGLVGTEKKVVFFHTHGGNKWWQRHIERARPRSEADVMAINVLKNDEDFFKWEESHTEQPAGTFHWATARDGGNTSGTCCPQSGTVGIPRAQCVHIYTRITCGARRKLPKTFHLHSSVRFAATRLEWTPPTPPTPEWAGRHETEHWTYHSGLVFNPHSHSSQNRNTHTHTHKHTTFMITLHFHLANPEQQESRKSNFFKKSQTTN